MCDERGGGRTQLTPQPATLHRSLIPFPYENETFPAVFCVGAERLRVGFRLPCRSTSHGTGSRGGSGCRGRGEAAGAGSCRGRSASRAQAAGGGPGSGCGERSEAARAFKRYLSLRPNAPDVAAIQKKLEEL